MLKTIIFLRHAKAEDAYLAENDFKRKLTERGITDSEKMGQYFTSLNIKPTIIYCSNSARTMQTLELFNQKAQLTAEIVFNPKLYHALASELLEYATSQTHQITMFVGHNMGISGVAHWLSESGVKELPTCGLVVLQFENKIEMRKGKVIAYQVPKEI